MLQMKPVYFLEKERSSKLFLEDFVEDLLQMHKRNSFCATTAEMQYILFHLSYS